VELLISIQDLTNGTAREIRQTVDGRISIGRGAGADIPLEGPDVSRPHCLLEFEDGQVYVEDQSRNGTFLNGARLPGGRRTPIGQDDVIGVPGYEIRVLQDETAAGRGSKRSPLAPVGVLWSSFSGFEKFSAMAALASLWVLAIYSSF
jgi:predicted component of type VI protein secretion system